MKLLSLKEIPTDVKIKLLEGLGYKTDGIFVLDKNCEKVKDKYTDDAIKIDNMLILPGSTVILDDNYLSVASYIAEYGDIL